MIPTFISSLFSRINVSPSPVFHQYPAGLLHLCCGNGVLRVLSEHGGLVPLLLDTQYHATRFATFLAWLHLSLVLQPTLSVCHQMVLVLACITGKYCFLFSLSTSRCTSDKPFLLLAPGHQHPLVYSRLLSAVNETYCNKQKKELNFRELHQLFDVSQFHQESLEEEGCHLRCC